VGRALALAVLAALAAGAHAQSGLRTRSSDEARIKSNLSADAADAVGERIDNYCDIFQPFYDELGLDRKNDNTIIARVFSTYDEFASHYERRNPGEDPPLAYFSSSMNALVLYDDDADVTLRQTLLHECSHQFFYRYVYGAPSWINEGLAEYFEGWRVTQAGELVEKRPNVYDLIIVQNALRDEAYVRPRELVAMESADFRDFDEDHPELHGYLHYVTAWSIVWYCLEMGPEEDRERMVDYLRELNRRGERAELQVDDWDAFEERWRAAILRLEPERSDAADHVLIAGGHRSNRDWLLACDEYRAALAKDPEAPGVPYWLGYCYKRRGRYADAAEWLERAREADPDNPSAPYLLARIALGIDKRDAASDPARALALAEEACELDPSESVGYRELLARCQAATGDFRSALRTARRIARDVRDDDALVAYYEAFVDELKAAQRAARD